MRKAYFPSWDYNKEQQLALFRLNKLTFVRDNYRVFLLENILQFLQRVTILISRSLAGWQMSAMTTKLTVFGSSRRFLQITAG